MTDTTTAAPAPVLVLLEHTADGTLRAPTDELCTAARGLAAGGAVEAVWVAGDEGDTPAPAVLEHLGTLGVARVHRLVAEGGTHGTALVAQGLTTLLDEVAGARAVLLASSFENKEVAARLAVRTGAGVVTDADDVVVEDGRVVTGKTVFAGTWTTRCAVATPLAVVTLKANAVPAAPAEAATAPEVVDVPLVPDAVAAAVTLVERTERDVSGRPDLSSAHVVVVGGRGTEGDFSPVEELADVLGGAVGATRVATDEGWIAHDAQIGQTGVTISPRLYIGAGVSGAVHHRGGMQASGTIVAVNADPDAPIFEIADLGIVGDLFTVLPQAAAELRRLRG
ncbi:electron transfer flavoprotein subunit alpha/FixB family protein [Cellulomonas marina]|uniref:Electron transfer flavoprotein alpha subunit n=1 Tax=Cellulomonas marina TaxID=988821 RepID=A0A1I0YKM6_9CELL|nr:electron transfer flavoprotein subunit alpha/FixB family protein [Cellulomonas marina]GIG30689.1 electron transfer flavoprotein subunit alpha [Cellulomonas marina]SFB13955.1 electron transfer flavoprotein alpha subunit [Cellulomonas marina]